MNFLAHLLLSGDCENTIMGNFTGDFVKGKLTDSRVRDWDADYTRGVRLHRFIDNFTDTHDEVRLMRRNIGRSYTRVTGVAVDIFFDHFLAIDFQQYSSEKFPDFCERMYGVVERNDALVPPEMKPMVTAMIRYKWLQGYSTLEGIERALSGLANRYEFMADIKGAEKDLITNFELYQGCFNRFFPELMNAAQHFLTDNS